MALGCGVSPRREIEAPLAQEGSSSPTSYSHEISEAERERIRKGCSVLRRGDAYQQIVNAVGKPQSDNILATKDGQFRERVLHYYFKRVDKELVNERFDELITMHLDAQGKLKQLSSNVAGIPSW
jgi:hypothetical protein